ncbi:P-loop containing nucleoside triphosphate hydrolase protein [Dichomitus squalens LYAD-421 SS1]|uniref:P-loop containing nucleoside triphosphate hydrolase protein n=1 Tax=Dichomitus squalens (strain LYAD-421) TaxID=732165 RepID=UPI00044156E4|nr:P-loop containing nucleoside triphosphate hydrolase protein [Dichomitus squalens LYAD-421 SS1]EJF65241.1 P-loop containing nucleoside triphosphate hydrolase protein [Dichomitus squalens LYAD-421 SS1]
MSNRGPCRFYGKPGGCSRGSDCHFQHVDGGSSESNISSGSSRGRGAPRGGAPRPAIPRAPHGVCDFYYSRGFCNRGSDCRFRHESPSQGTIQPSSTPAVDVSSLLTPAALARIQGPGTDGFFISSTKEMKPSEVDYHLRRFLEDSFRFKLAADAYGFVALMNNASSGNSSWSPEDGQLFLSRVGTGNGLLRIGDILGWTHGVAIRPRDRTSLSFGRGYIPLLRYLSSEYVVKSITSKTVNSLYSLIMEHFDRFSEIVKSCMEDAFTIYKSFKEPGQADVMGSSVLSSIAQVLFEYITRYKNAVATHPSLRDFVTSLHGWTEAWIEGISADPPTFDDPIAKAPQLARHFVIERLRGLVDRLVAIVDRKHRDNERGKQPLRNPIVAMSASNEGILAALHNAYEGPGILRPGGPRHNNDFVNIADIQIAPTHEELTSLLQPFLPANLYGAPHPLPSESMEQLLDVQFRLLREELTASLRTSAQAILSDLKQESGRTQLDDILKKRGGKYRGHAVGQDTVLFNVYTNAEFLTIAPTQRGLTVGISIDAPPGRARASQAGSRAHFWESMSSKRLMQGGLVALIWQRGETIEVHLGTVASSLKDLTESAKQSADRVGIRLSFFSPEVELRILQELRLPAKERRSTMLLVEATVMFESVRPFLEALRVEPESVPFGRYLVHRPPKFFETFTISPPAYATLPGYSFQLASLFPSESGVEDLKLIVNDPTSIETARDVLKRSSRLDPSQADAMVDTLTREVSLIQGPPGTGKSYTGVELLRVLIKNHAGPILMIAFTNHALDHMLRSVLDADITKQIVRLGSRSADERIAEFSLEHQENIAGRTRLSSAFYTYRRALRDVEDEIKEFMKDFFKTEVGTEKILSHLCFQCPGLVDSFELPPPWIAAIHSLTAAEQEEWNVAGRNGKDVREVDNSLYGFWLRGGDIKFLHDTHYAMRYRQETTSQLTAQKRPANRYELLQPEQPEVDQVQEPQMQSTPITTENVAVTDRNVDADSDAESDFAMSDASAEEEWLNDAVLPDLDELMTMEEEEHPRSPQLIPVAADSSGSSPTSNVPPQPHAMPQIHTMPQPHAIPEPHPDVRSEAIRPDDFTDIREFFAAYGCPDIPPVPASTRPIPELLEADNVWLMSSVERQQLHAMWSDEVRIASQDTQTQEFRRLREKHERAAQEFSEGQAEIRKQLLRNVDIIGCTTTGAAKLTALLKGIGPKVLLVEEAGQVLEAHVLGSLVPSVQHMILIGDPLQLRPTLNNYTLSMDHHHGKLVYKLDMSLMERLSSSGLPMSQINVQRRMRPEIADLVRMTLYPKLEDHELVKNYPHVQGMAKDVFFFTHDHKENGGEDDFVSKYNQFEVDMIKDLVLYLLRQGPYSAEGDIVVLCAYLGQLSRLRDALSNEVAVVLDERDQAELDDRNAEAEDVSQSTSAFERVKVSHRVLLRTIDNFQGEEAKIVILSLVRNSGGSEEDEVYGHQPKGRANIGFLRSENRTNVALSRAREGMYIMGNATNLSARSKMWREVIEELGRRDCLGTAFPIACQRHPHTVESISKPGQLPRIAPDGGCLLQCDTRLKCGHLCPYKCHSDDPRHVSVSCVQRCTRICPRQHPCTKQCAEPCGECRAEITNVQLPCGHTIPRVFCFEYDSLENVFCPELVTKKLPGCEHEATMRCSDNPRRYPCRAKCGGIMSCCGRPCKANCHECQFLNTAPEPRDDKEDEVAEELLPVERLTHVGHPCERSLFCGHLCGKQCSSDHECTTECKEACRQVCAHARCRNYCSVPCAPCQEPCTWRCAHFSCPLPCGAICARLPCDKRCDQLLDCGHRCPSVCGEDCSIQVCPLCAGDEVKSNVVDLVMQTTMADLDYESESLDNLLITIPNCGHVFTVETLDGHCELTEYYQRDGPDGKWIGLEAPPPGFKKPPTCPTCRGAITAPRYGRAFKRADLDILENNVAFHMSKSLRAVQAKLAAISTPQLETKSKAVASELTFAPLKVSTKVLKALQREQGARIKSIRSVPFTLPEIDPLNAALHGLPSDEARAWKKVVLGLFTAYKDTITASQTRSAHSHAWEASFAYLYQKEMDDIVANPIAAPRNPQEYAIRAARMKVGQPPPRADKRFLVEAFWATINIRLTIASLARTWLEALTKRQKYPPENRRVWATYVHFLLRSCAADAELALRITQESESNRQEAKTALLIMRVELEQFRFNVRMMEQNGKMSPENRTKMADSALEKISNAHDRVSDLRRRSAARKRRPEETDWMQAEFVAPAQTILDDWRAFERSLRDATFYQPVSLDELTQVVQSLGFTHVGHFYKCPNGHVFVIGECGGAMQQSFCNECGEAIGGSHHNLLATNQPVRELEEIAREHGARPSPWNWAIRV